jgi:hypothetical protein
METTNMEQQAAKVETYNLLSRDGKNIRQATKVAFPDGVVVKFIDKLPKKEAIKQALERRAGTGDKKPTKMKVFSCQFAGHYPVGAVALVSAEDISQARKLMEDELKLIGLPQDVTLDMLQEFGTDTQRVEILLDGDY